MTRFQPVFQTLQRHKWAVAAVMTIGTLLARDPAVGGMLTRSAERAREVLGFRDNSADDPAHSGFVRYAAMVNSRDQLEQTRRAYNEAEGTLRGDALLEAQDRLRSDRARYRQARLAFLPELARQCERARVPLPADAAQALAALQSEAGD